MVSKKTKLRIRRVPSSREPLQPVMVSKKKALSRTLLSSRERDKTIMDLILTGWRNYTYVYLGREAVVQSLNDPCIDLSEGPPMDMGSGASAWSNFDWWSCATVWRMLLNMTWSVLSNKIQMEELKPGDHIYTWRHTYSYAHHGIYIGDGKVIHSHEEEEKIVLYSARLHPIVQVLV